MLALIPYDGIVEVRSSTLLCSTIFSAGFRFLRNWYWRTIGALLVLTLATVCYKLLRMNLLEVRQRLHILCEDAGSIKAWAEANSIAFGYVAAVRRGDAKPGRKLLRAMGLRKAFTDKKTTVMKFEDI